MIMIQVAPPLRASTASPSPRRLVGGEHVIPHADRSCVSAGDVFPTDPLQTR